MTLKSSGDEQPRRQEPPFALQIELVEGCNLYCDFCGLQGIRTKENKKFKFMAEETLINIVDMLPAHWNPRIEFAMHGEPTMHPHLIDMLSRVPKRLHSMVTSNGGGLLKDPEIQIRQILACVDTLALDNYEYVKIVPKILEKWTGPVRYYPQDKKASPHSRDVSGLVIIQDISKAESGTHSTLNNHAGSAFPKVDCSDPCAKPFRELSVRWDGSIAICCNDWRGEYVIGNVNEDPIEELWHSERFEAARRRLIRGMRNFTPCQGCDAKSYRTGLLPDKMGQELMPYPKIGDDAIIKEAIGDGPLTQPVQRYYEIGR